MIKARHIAFFIRFFHWYINLLFQRRFKKIHLLGDYTHNSNPVFVIANHFSWWDGFFILYLNHKVLKKKFHVMMLEDQLKKNRVLNKIGAFSVKFNSRETLSSLYYASQIINSINNLLLIFPQGELNSVYQNEFNFHKGIARIHEMSDKKYHLLFCVTLIDYFEAKKPSVYIYYKMSDKLIDSDIQDDYQMFYNECLAKQKALKV